MSTPLLFQWGTASPLMHFVILPCSSLLSFFLHRTEQHLFGKMRQLVNCHPCGSSMSKTFQNQTCLACHFASFQACPKEMPQPKSQSFLKSLSGIRHGGSWERKTARSWSWVEHVEGPISTLLALALVGAEGCSAQQVWNRAGNWPWKL